MEMEPISKPSKNIDWKFSGNNTLVYSSSITVKGAWEMVIEKLDPNEKKKSTIFLGVANPSSCPLFMTCRNAVKAVCDAIYSDKYNGYAPSSGVRSTRQALANYLSKDLPYKLSSDDVYVTSGSTQGMKVIVNALASPKANILLPRPGFSCFEVCAQLENIEFRHFDLIPSENWKVDLLNLKKVWDKNTAAMVIVNPGNPCGNVYTYDHLKDIAETARELGIFVIADEVYGHLTFGDKKFVPMGVFGSIVPVVTLGSLSHRWAVPGWRLGWLVINDPNCILKEYGIVNSIKACMSVSTSPATFIQGAIPRILKNTSDTYFSTVIDVLTECAELSYTKLKEIPFFTCASKPEGSLFMMVKLNLSRLDVENDKDFCFKLAKEESVILLPGFSLGLENWVRISFATEKSHLIDGIERIKCFCERHEKKISKIPEKLHVKNKPSYDYNSFQMLRKFPIRRDLVSIK